MEGSKPTPEQYLAEYGNPLEIQTDKDAWKIIPCTYEGCDVHLIVNTFYAPHKGKCASHGTKSSSAISSSRLTADNGTAQPNGALAKLLCPLCGKPMMLKSINEIGHMTFVCIDGIEMTPKEYYAKMNAAAERNEQFFTCNAAIIIKPRWAGLEMNQGYVWPQMPSTLKDMMDEFNLNQRMNYFEHIGF